MDLKLRKDTLPEDVSLDSLYVVGQIIRVDENA